MCPGFHTVTKVALAMVMRTSTTFPGGTYFISCLTSDELLPKISSSGGLQVRKLRCVWLKPQSVEDLYASNPRNYHIWLIQRLVLLCNNQLRNISIFPSWDIRLKTLGKCKIMNMCRHNTTNYSVSLICFRINKSLYKIHFRESLQRRVILNLSFPLAKY
jgi:hypothetical protein